MGALIRQLAATHAVLLIEHDIDRVLALSDRITVLHQGRVIADGKPAEVASNPDVITAYMGTARAGGPQPPVQAEAPRAARRSRCCELEQVRAGYAGSLVLTDLDLIVHEGEAVALLGRNGVGKTTMLRAITGTVQTERRADHDGWYRHHACAAVRDQPAAASRSCRKGGGCSRT